MVPSDIRYFSIWWRDKDLIRVTSGDFSGLTDDQIKKSFSSLYKSKNDFHYIITHNSFPIGHIALCLKNRGQYETQVIIGEKKFQNRGYGTRAILQLIHKAYSKGIKNIFLEVRPDNKRAIHAYEKCGFRSSRIKKYPNNKNLPSTIEMIL